MTPDEAIERAGEIEAETAYRSQIARESFEAGAQYGYKRGVEAARGELSAGHAAWWRGHGQRLIDEPSHAELEERRWGPGGREHFGDPRPGDFPGTGRTAAEAEADTEIEELEMTA